MKHSKSTHAPLPPSTGLPLAPSRPSVARTTWTACERHRGQRTDLPPPAVVDGCDQRIGGPLQALAASNPSQLTRCSVSDIVHQHRHRGTHFLAADGACVLQLGRMQVTKLRPMHRSPSPTRGEGPTTTTTPRSTASGRDMPAKFAMRRSKTHGGLRRGKSKRTTKEEEVCSAAACRLGQLEAHQLCATITMSDGIARAHCSPVSTVPQHCVRT